MSWFTSSEAAMRLSIGIASIGVAIWSLEYLAQFRAFKMSGIHNWSLLKYQHRFTSADTLVARVLDTLLRYPNVLVILTSRVIMAFVLVFFVANPHCRLVGIAGIYLTNLLFLQVWTSYPRGSDGMTAVLFGVLLLVELGGESPFIVEAGLWFIALQVCVSYCANGFSKIGKEPWMQGTAAFAIANHRSCGTPAGARFLEPRPRLVKALTWSALAMECLFPIVLVTGWPGCVIFLAWGVLFHLASTYVIGLNSFLWSYLATYPAVIFVSLRLQEWI